MTKNKKLIWMISMGFFILLLAHFINVYILKTGPFHPISIPGFNDPVSCWTHLLAAGFFSVACVSLLRRGRGNFLRITSLVVYSVSLVFLLAMSGVYHLLAEGYEARSVLRYLDHAGIWTLIAGTFTPIHTILFRRWKRWGFLFLIWAMAIPGLVLTTVFFKAIPPVASLSMYIGLGWMGILSTYLIARTYGKEEIGLIVAGGISYTIGGVCEYLKWPILIPGVFGPHEFFHIAVILGAYWHFRLVFNWSNHLLQKRLIFIVKEEMVQGVPQGIFSGRARGENIWIHATSREELYRLIQKSIREKSHPANGPQEICLEFFCEEKFEFPIFRTTPQSG